MPKVEEFAELACAENVMKEVNRRMDSCAVLIYANGDLHDNLAKEDLVTRVTPETPAADLRSMDVTKWGIYPVYLINEKYGIRGLDYRAEKNPIGICMLICSMFSDNRTRI